tara:strand:- start:8296 stop:8565 length:270 start_codon:yes stop_codon:yes gene_type:complete
MVRGVGKLQGWGRKISHVYEVSIREHSNEINRVILFGKTQLVRWIQKETPLKKGDQFEINEWTIGDWNDIEHLACQNFPNCDEFGCGPD